MAEGKIPGNGWKKAGETIGNHSVDLRGISYSEIFAAIDINQSGNKVTFYLIKDQLPISGTNWYRAGGEHSGAATGSLGTIGANATGATLISATVGGTDYLSNSKLIVYYR